MQATDRSPEEGRSVRIGRRVVRVTEAYDTYWKFAAERQAIFFRRLNGRPLPWTEDDVLKTHRFTNVYRASDRVSQFLIRNVIYQGDSDCEETFFRILLFKLFNRIETWDSLSRALGMISWREYDFRRYNDCLDAIFHGTDTVYSAAYIMPSPAFGEARKHANHLKLIEHMMRDRAPAKATATRSLDDLFRLLRGYRSLGDFLAFQLAIDINYSPLVNFSEMEFVVAGPGARDGISKCFVDLTDITAEYVIAYMAEAASDEFTRLKLDFQTLWTRPLQLIDCQNIFCELSKYARVKHPGIVGISGRTRIKQKFSPKLTPLPQMYPPKWGLDVSCSGACLAGPAQQLLDFPCRVSAS